MHRQICALVSALTPAIPAAQELQVAEGFSISRAIEEQHSYLALTFDAAGRMVLATEDQGLLSAIDADGDGVWEDVGPLAPDLERAQGLCFAGATLFAVGRRGERSAVWRITPTDDLRGVREMHPLVPIDDADEHGAHGITLGPDGDLYVAVGDEARFTTPPEKDGWQPTDVAPLLSALTDPGGFGARRRFPYGFVARVDPDAGDWRYHSVGYRNHYDLAFSRDGSGRLFTCDSDMELDVGLPWYRPVRVVECIEHADYGSRPGSATWPAYLPEVPASEFELGRGSPTGICFYDGQLFPKRYREALLIGDWTSANVRAVFPFPGDGSTEVLVQARGALNVTDLAMGPDGAVYLVTGGRGTRGSVYRLGYATEAGGPPDVYSRELARVDPDPYAGVSRETVRAMLAMRGNATGQVFGLRWLARDAVAGGDDPLIAPLIDEVAPSLLEHFPRGDASVDRELARVLAHAQVPGVIEALLAELERTPSREDAIHYAYCLRAIEAGWNDALLARLFGWFEEAAAWSGGGNFQGYLDAMLGEIVDRCAPQVAARASAADVLGPRVLASFLSRKAASEVEPLFSPLRAAFDVLGEDENVGLAMRLKRNLLTALDGTRVEGLETWLREVYADEPRLRGACLTLLARTAADEDWERFVHGLEHGNRDVRLACVRALVKSDRVPEGAAPVRTTLDQARARGPRGGRGILRVLAKWSGRPLGSSDADWTGELAEWERWFAGTYPGFAGTPAADARPRWDFEEALAFLSHSETRAGSAARGARVFEKATCNTCHTMAGGGAGWGPDLTDVAGRFERRALLEAIVYPSRVIADRYDVTRVVTHDGNEHEGRLVQDAPERLVLLRTNGTKTTIERADTRFVGPSDVSAMPSGLLDALTLEEVKDLFAYVAARGVVDAAARAEPQWIAAFSDGERARWGGNFRGWRLAQGTLVGRAKNQPESTYIVYGRELDDFEMEFDVRCVQANSGVQYRSRVVADEVHPIGYQADIGQSFWGALYASDGRGLLARPEPRPRNQAVDYQGWNHYHVRVDGDRHVIEINGRTLVDTRDGQHTRGVLALQLHEKLDMTVSFANFRVRSLR
ncbi:MAG: DUF1080 domain-containing protein [bacterium]|nr:DUF1080 domain-containing protein [bacterium]